MEVFISLGFHKITIINYKLQIIIGKEGLTVLANICYLLSGSQLTVQWSNVYLVNRTDGNSIIHGEIIILLFVL